MNMTYLVNQSICCRSHNTEDRLLANELVWDRDGRLTVGVDTTLKDDGVNLGPVLGGRRCAAGGDAVQPMASRVGCADRDGVAANVEVRRIGSLEVWCVSTTGTSRFFIFIELSHWRGIGY